MYRLGAHRNSAWSVGGFSRRKAFSLPGLLFTTETACDRLIYGWSAYSTLRSKPALNFHHFRFRDYRSFELVSPSRAQTVTGKNLPPSPVAGGHDFPIASYIPPNSSLPQMTIQSQHNRAGGGKPGIQCRPSW